MGKRTKLWQRWLSLLLAIYMALSNVPFDALAQETEKPTAQTEAAGQWDDVDTDALAFLNAHQEESLTGKKISILGDSISTFTGYIPVADGVNLEHASFYPERGAIKDVNETWWMQVITELGGSLGINDSWSGSRVLNTQEENSGNLGPDAAMASMTRIRNLGSNGTPDIILFFGGTNDIAFGSPLGSFDPATAPAEADLTANKWDTYAEAYTAAILRIQHLYPDAQVFAIEPTENTYYYDLATLNRYGAVMEAICDHYGVTYVDLVEGGFTTAMLADATHPNASGMDKITEIVVDAINEEPAATEPLAGKTLSILGASISTFAGTSNGAAADTTNSTIRNNVKYYPNTTIPSVELSDTWWMQTVEELDLRLLVNNAWSGSAILLERSGTVGAYVDRCVQLHDDTGSNAGEEPDIICIQMGFNDFSYGKDTLGTSDIDYDALITSDGYGTPATTMEATAIMLDKITKRYPNAQVYMFNHFKRIGQSASDTALMEGLNASIETVCDRFGVTVVDLYTTLTKEAYIGDGRLHPNPLGMDVICEAVKKAILAGHEQETVYSVSCVLDGVNADCIESKRVLSGGSFAAELTAADPMEVTVTMGGADITASAYAEGKISIASVTGDVVITAKSVHVPRDYRWEFNGTDLTGENTLTKTGGTTTDGVFSTTRYTLEEAVVLNHDRPWVVEWKCQGTFLNANGSSGARVFTSDNVNAHYNARYIFKSNTDGLIAMGEKTTTGSHNYGIALADYGIDWTAEHIYRLENRIAADGSNMVWLYVDGEEIGPMVHYHVGTTDKNTTSNWLSGKDFRFPYMGTDTHGFTNASIDYIAVWEGGFTHAVPESRGAANAIARAYALTDVEWTPKKDVPGVQKIDGAYTVVPFKAGVTYKGIPYSGVIATDTYVGLNVSLESFLTALENENSVLYTENLYSTNPKSATYFGTVCSKFAQYVLDVPGSFNTNNVANIPGMETVAMPGEYTLEQVKLGDVILDVVYHTAVCTDLLYDAQGNVAYIEISEAVMPVVRRKLWTPEEFYAEFADYRLCRYAYLDSVPAVPSSQVRTSYALMPRLGDKYNYPVSTTKGVVDVLESGYSTAVILRDGAVAEEIALNGASSFSFDRTVPGKLEMYLVKADGSRSGSVYANVVASSVAVTNAENYANGQLTVSFSGSSGTPLYVQVGSGQSVFCSIEGKQDSAELSFAPARVSNQRIRVAYQNEYGIYLSDWVGFTADTNPSDDPLLSQGQYWDGQNITPGSHIPAVQEGKEGYWTYTMVPVEPNTAYYSQGATRLWYLDEKGQPISTYNAYKDSEVPFQFTTPENAAYVSIAYSPKLVEKGTESLKNVSQEESLAGNTIALGDFAVAGVGTGALTASATQLSQRTLIAVPYPGAQLSIFVKDGYQACVYSGNNNNKIDRNSGWLGTDGDHTSIYTYTLPADAIYMRVSLRKMDGSAMTAEDITHSGLAVAYECGSDVVEDNADVAEILENTELPVLLHISDIHGDVIRAGRAAQFADAVGADALLASGDLTAYEPDDWGHALFDAVGNYPNVNFIYGIGNHDAKISASAYRETIYHSYFRENPDTPNGETYYYRDLAGQKLRIISVNQQEGASTTTSGGTCYSQTQVDWLVETLKSTPAGYGVVLMYHSPETTIAGAESSEYSEFFQVGNRYDNPTNSYSGYSGTFLMDLVDAFMLRKNFVWNYSEKNGTSPVTLSADFTQVAEGVEFIAHITGHVHSDSVTYLPGTACKQLLLGVTCTTSMYGADGGYYGLADYSDLKREAHNANQDAFNAYVIDRTNKTVRVLRVGARRTLSDGIRDDMTIPYSIPFTEGEYPFDTEGLVKLDLSNVEWVNYGFQPDGVEPTYYPGLRYSTDAIFDVPYEGVTFYVKINAPFEMGIRSGATDTTMNTNHYWLSNKDVVAGTNNRGYTCTIPAGHKKFILSIANVVRGSAVLTQNYMNELELELAGVEIWYEPIAQPLPLRYDDHYDISGKEVEIVDAGKPTSYQVGYGVEENAVPDTAVVTIEGDYLVATGIGTAQVIIDGQLYDVTVTAAPISLLLLAGQSNMRGSEGNAAQSIVCPDGMVYATYGDDRGADNTAMTAANAAQFAPSALTGAYSGINVTGTTDCLSGYPVYSLTEAGAGKIGPDSGFAYEWVKSTGEKVWIVNAAHGGTSINVWQPGKTEYEECQALFTACTETLRKEIAAGHFTLSHMAYFWCQGCSDRTQSAQWYVQKYLAMHEGFKTELAFDHDSNAATADKTFEFGGIIPVRVGSTAACYRDGVSPYTNSYAYHESFVDLRFSGPRVAQYWMINNPELTDIWGVCDIGKDWVWMPDGTNGVSAYFQSHYENGTVDYTTQVAQKVSWYTPTTPKAVHDSIHYNQIGYNEVGRESVRNALILLGETAIPEAETTVELLTWDGITPAKEIKAWTTGNSGSLVVPMVSPIWKAKTVTYDLTDGLTYNYYDLLADTAQTEGTLTASTGETVAVVKQEPGAYFAEHLSTLPENLCCGVNLWNALDHDKYFYSSGTNWGIHSSGNVYSVTIPVQPGDKIFATAFGKVGENGHATTSGIRCTFFGEYAVVKTLDPGGTYAEFSKNGGYLIVPEGAVAMNIPMWTGDDTNELYILNLPHDRTEGICGICGKDSHVHSWGDWEITQAPTAEALGIEQRKCACGETESREVEGVWQKYALADHMQEMPESYCAETNLWTALEHDVMYFASGTSWGKYSGGGVCSVTIPVQPGDKIFATSFGKAKENGHATSSGIRCTFFDAYGVCKTLNPAETYAEFSANGGYLVAPEGAVAFNVPMWNGSEENELYILNAPHSYGYAVTQEPTPTETGVLTGTCKDCGGGTTVELPILSEEAYDYAVTKAPTTAENGTAIYTWKNTDYGTITITVELEKLAVLLGDVDGNGTVNTRDRIILTRYLANWEGYDEEDVDLLAADVNQDGIVNTKDRIILTRYLANWVGYEELPYKK